MSDIIATYLVSHSFFLFLIPLQAMVSLPLHPACPFQLVEQEVGRRRAPLPKL